MSVRRSIGIVDSYSETVYPKDAIAVRRCLNAVALWFRNITPVTNLYSCSSQRLPGVGIHNVSERRTCRLLRCKQEGEKQHHHICILSSLADVCASSSLEWAHAI